MSFVRDDCGLNGLYICIQVRFGNRDSQISPNLLYSHPCFIRFPPYLIVFASRFLLCHLFGMRSGCVRDDCWLFILVVIPYIFILVISCAPQRGNFSTAQGIALGMMWLWALRPVGAALIARCFYSCPYRALAVCVRLPRAMPWAMETLGFQPVFAHTLLVSRPCTYVVGIVSLQTLLVSRPC